jgi:hypothetical protein
MRRHVTIVMVSIIFVICAVSSAPMPEEATPDDIIPEKPLLPQDALIQKLRFGGLAKNYYRRRRTTSPSSKKKGVVQEAKTGCVVAHGRINDAPGTSISDLAHQMSNGHLFFGGQAKWAKCSKGKCSVDIAGSLHVFQKAFVFLHAMQTCPPANKKCAASIYPVAKAYTAFAAAARVTEQKCKGKGKGRTGTCIVTKSTMKSLFHTIKYMVDSTQDATPGNLKQLNILDKQGPLMMTATFHSMGEFFSAATASCTALQKKAAGAACAASSAQLIKHLHAISTAGMNMSKACTPDRHIKKKMWKAAKLEAHLHELAKKQLPKKKVKNGQL